MILVVCTVQDQGDSISLIKISAAFLVQNEEEMVGPFLTGEDERHGIEEKAFTSFFLPA